MNGVNGEFLTKPRKQKQSHHRTHRPGSAASAVKKAHGSAARRRARPRLTPGSPTRTMLLNRPIRCHGGSEHLCRGGAVCDVELVTCEETVWTRDQRIRSCEEIGKEETV